MIKVITSYSIVKVPEGKRVSFTYSEIDENTGNIIKSNERASFAVLNNAELEGHIDAIEQLIKQREGIV